MRRLPVYFLVDVSESMVGEPIQQVENGMRQIVQELRTDPYALETAFISVIAFAGKAKSLSPLTELYKFYPPTFPIGGGTSLGAALDFLMDDIDRNVVKTTEERKGDWKPIIFLFTDGTPTDNPSAAFARWNNKYRRKANLVAISIGNNVNTQLLGQISDNVLVVSCWMRRKRLIQPTVSANSKLRFPCRPDKLAHRAYLQFVSDTATSQAPFFHPLLITLLKRYHPHLLPGLNNMR